MLWSCFPRKVDFSSFGHGTSGIITAARTAWLFITLRSCFIDIRSISLIDINIYKYIYIYIIYIIYIILYYISEF